MGDDVFVSIRQAARDSGLSVPLLRRRIAAGELQAYRTRADRRVLLLRAADVAALRDIEPVALAGIAA